MEKNKYIIRVEQHLKPRVSYYAFYRKNKKVVYYKSIKEAKKLRFGTILKVGKNLKDLKIIGRWGFKHNGKWGFFKKSRSE